MLKNKKFWIAVLVIFAVLNIVIFAFFEPIAEKAKDLMGKERPWFAVHLSNGQLYFGHIKAVRNEIIELSDVYFLEESKQNEEQANQGENFQVQPAPQKTYNLVPRGGDTFLTSDHNLFISLALVLYWEKLDQNSEVYKWLIKAGQK